MSGCPRLLLAAAWLSITLYPVQPCRAAQDWAAYMFNGGFEAGDHVDPGETSSKGTLKLDGIDPSSFVATASVVTFVADETLLATDPASVLVLRNGLPIQASHVQLSTQSVALNGALLPGLNHLVVLAQDVNGNALSAEVELWAGSNQLLVQVLGEDDTPMSSTPVRLELADARAVSGTVVSMNGTASFANVPPTTITLTARGDGNTFGQLSTTGDVGSEVLRLQGFRPTSVVDNNDFSLGIQGWEIGAAPVSLVAHDESGGGSLPSGAKYRGTRNPGVQRPAERRSDAGADDHILDTLVGAAGSKGNDVDLLLSTSGVGSRTLSRTFNAAPHTSRIKVRYRFITSEAPAGYFGSQYNDSYSVVIRTADGESIRMVSDSMNRLGIDAFDANGATRWYSLTLPLNGDGLDQGKAGSGTVQVDVSVTNVGDEEFDSAVVIDYIEQEPLSVSSDLSVACANQTVTFQVDGTPSGTINWTGGGQPATGTGAQFVTRFANPGQFTVQAEQNDSGTIRVADADVTIRETSGPAWAARFPTSVATADLVQPFLDNVDEFIGALRAGNATVGIAATLRPPERAHLMHYSYRVGHQGLDPETVPDDPGIDICWTHRDANGALDVAASAAAARAMVNAYGIQFPPALQSRHTQGRAIDMTIAWTGDLAIQTAGGGGQTITTLPRTGAGNMALHGVGAGYGVLKLVADPPHWSDDGH